MKIRFGSFLGILTLGIFLASATVWARPFHFTILHTNDLHSQVEGGGPDHYFTPWVGDGDPIKGHFGRLAYLIKKVRQEKERVEEPTLLLDGGDFYSGSLFSQLGPSKETSAVPELEFLNYCGYDAITLGNHDFDAGEKGLVAMMKKGLNQNLNIPLVTTNMEFTPQSELWWEFTDWHKEGDGGSPFHRVIVKELEGHGKKVKVGILGLMGPDAAFVSMGNRREVRFVGHDDKKSQKRMNDLIKMTQETINYLRMQKDVQVVVAVMHGGTPEDEALARGLTGLDVLVAGHTHEVYFEPKQVNKTLIVQAGSYGAYLGKLELTYDDYNKEVSLRNPSGPFVLQINDSTPVDKTFMGKIGHYKNEILSFFSPYVYLYDTEVFWAKEILLRRNLGEGEAVPNKLGVLITSGIVQELNRILPKPLDYYFTSMAMIRSDINLVYGQPTLYQFSDIFRMLGLGYDENGNPGTPVVSFYLTKKEVWQMVNFLELYRHVAAHFTPAFSGSLKYGVRSWGIPFVNRIKDLTLHGKPYEEWPELIHMGTGLYLAKYFSKVHSMSYGLLQLVPKDQNGVPLTSLKPYGPEVREYFLFADFLRTWKGGF